MSKRKATLEDFLETYIKNREIKNSALSYGDYLRTSGKEYDADYNAGRLTAALGRKQALSSFGNTAESLGESGLTDSGYAAHLRSRANERYLTELDSLEKTRDSARGDARRGYLKYLYDYDAKQSTLKNKVVESLVKNEILDTDEAYTYAIEAGLAPEAAAAASQSAHGRVRQALRLRVISEMFRHEIAPESAADYARELGLSEEDALDIAEIAERYRHGNDTYSKEYLDYLESIGNKTTVTYD